MEKNIIHQGDCLPIMQEMSDKCVDLVFTSPPYNMRTRIRNGEYVTREQTTHFSKKYLHFDDALPIDEFYQFHKKCLTEMLRISKIVVYNFQIVTGSKEAFFKMIGDFHKDIKDIIIWDKGCGQPAMHDKVLNSAYELLLVLEDDKKAGRLIQNATFNRGEMNNILRIGRGTKIADSHSAIFPCELAEQIIGNFSSKGDIVLDPFAGYGTVGVACKNLDRAYILIEQNPHYVKAAQKRIANTQNLLFSKSP